MIQKREEKQRSWRKRGSSPTNYIWWAMKKLCNLFTSLILPREKSGEPATYISSHYPGLSSDERPWKFCSTITEMSLMRSSLMRPDKAVRGRGFRCRSEIIDPPGDAAINYRHTEGRNGSWRISFCRIQWDHWRELPRCNCFSNK